MAHEILPAGILTKQQVQNPHSCFCHAPLLSELLLIDGTYIERSVALHHEDLHKKRKCLCLISVKK